MEYDQFNAAKFKKDEPAVIYVGTMTTKGFKIKETIADTSVTGEYTYFNFTVKLDRVYTDKLISSFFPTLLLWFLAYFTLYIHHENFNERIMVAITVLLVLAALMGSIKNDIPSTSEFKYIDLWFLWYTSFIFGIALFHIFLHQIGAHEMYINSRKRSLNDIMKRVMLILFLSFNLIYFLLQTVLQIGK